MSEENPRPPSLLYEWLKPGSLLQIIGFIALIAAAWQQIGQNTRDIETLRRDGRDYAAETRRQLDRMDDKLTRLIERNGK